MFRAITWVVVVLRTSSYIPPFAANPPKIASRSPSDNYPVSERQNKRETSAHVTTNPEKNIFESGEKHFGLYINLKNQTDQTFVKLFVVR
jgi:hypothetical protein